MMSSSQFEVKDKVALVTGAASGIGLAITECLLEKGAKVHMVDINEVEGLKTLSSLCEQYSTDVVSFTKVDVSVTEQLASAFVKTKETFGRLDIVCNNAGISEEENWKKMFEVNVFAIIEGISLAIEHMSTAKGGKGGVVINTASTTGLAPHDIQFAKYTATKHAIVGYTRVNKPIAASDGIRVNCICPAMVDTPAIQKFLARQPPPFSPEIMEQAKSTMLTPKSVAEGVLQLITDTSKAGDVMAVTFGSGCIFPKLLDLPDLYPEMFKQNS